MTLIIKVTRIIRVTKKIVNMIFTSGSWMLGGDGVSVVYRHFGANCGIIR